MFAKIQGRSYIEYRDYIDEQTGNLWSLSPLKIGPKTSLEWSIGLVYVNYHNERIITYTEDGRVDFSDGDRVTTATVNRLNYFGPGLVFRLHKHRIRFGNETVGARKWYIVSRWHIFKTTAAQGYLPSSDFGRAVTVSFVTPNYWIMDLRHPNVPLLRFESLPEALSAKANLQKKALEAPSFDPLPQHRSLDL